MSDDAGGADGAGEAGRADGTGSGDGTRGTAAFVSGLELNAAFHDEVVAPLLGRWRPAAALLGWGSDVLGYDTARSTDHGWGPRLEVFVAPADVATVRTALADGLPDRFRGFPVRYGWDREPVQHHVGVGTWPDWVRGALGGSDPWSGLGVVDWLVVPQQALLGVVGGAVYADPTGELAAVRARLAWYPDQVWRWLIACQWRRIAQEEAFPGRTAEVGDELGSRILAARLVRELMRLAFLLDRRYAPYPKWFGTAFAALPGASRLAGPLARALAAGTYPEREAALVAAYEAAAAWHDEVLPDAAADPVAGRFHERPYRVLGADRFVDRTLATVTEPRLRDLPLVGSVDQAADSTDVLAATGTAARLRALYEAR